MPLDPSIPLSVKTIQMPSAAESLARAASLKSLGQQQQIQQQQIQQNDAALAEAKRQTVGRDTLSKLIQANTKADDKGKLTVDHQAIATGMGSAGFPDLAEAWLKTAAANSESLDKLAESKRQHNAAHAAAFGDLAYRANSAAEMTSSIAQAAMFGLLDDQDAQVVENELEQAGPNGWKALKDKYQQFSPAYQEQQKELSKPVKVGEGDVLNTPERAAQGLPPLMTGGDKPKDEWQSFRAAYATKAGAKDWASLSPDQQMAGFSAFTLAKQDPAMHALLKDNAEIRNLMMQAQLGQQPTEDDAKLFANEMLAHKLAPSQIQLFGGFGGQGAMFKRMVGKEALKADPNFDWEQAEADYQFSKSQGFQSTTRFMQSVLESMPRLLENAKKLGNVTVRDINALVNKGKTEFNSVDLKRFNTDRLLVGDEVAKILQGGGTGSATSDAKLKQAAAILSENDSVPAIAAAMDEINTLIGYRQKSLTRGTYLERQQKPAQDAKDLPAGLPQGATITRH